MTLDDRLAASLDALAIAPDAPVGVACSGGADSIALLHLLARSRRNVTALHVDHGLREGSEQDVTFARDAAEQLGVGFDTRRVDVDRSTGSLEAAARDARYAALREMAERSHLRFVATAHTLDDQAETVLLRAMRGGSLDAIASVRGPFVRPLLSFRRDELRAWLESNGIAWLEDPTNLDTRFERNWVRHVLMPQLRDRRAGVDTALARVATHHGRDRAALDVWASEVFDRARIDDVGVFLDADLGPPAIATRVIRAALRHLGVEAGADEVEGLRIMDDGHARCGTADVWRLPTGLAFVTQAPVLGPVLLPAQGIVSDDARGLRVRVGSPDVPAWRWRATVPASTPLHLRSRRPGDRVGSKKVQDVLVDAKVPRPLRDLVGIVASDSGALAVVGHTRNEQRGMGSMVVDVECVSTSWSREMVWVNT